MAEVKTEMKYIRARMKEMNIREAILTECERLLRSGGVDKNNPACTKITLSVALHNVAMDTRPLHPENLKAWHNLKRF